MKNLLFPDPPPPPMAVSYTRQALEKMIARHGFDIGEYSYGVPRIIWCREPVRLVIGKYCSIAENVSIFLGCDHRVDWITTYPFPHVNHWSEAHGIVGHPCARGDVVIGDDVRLAASCVILSGVKIGDGAVMAANSVVSEDVEPYAIVAGNPAKVVKKRFPPKDIALLQEIRWWDWTEQQVREAIPILCSGNVKALHTHWKKSVKSA